jgi:hypothetical protein
MSTADDPRRPFTNRGLFWESQHVSLTELAMPTSGRRIGVLVACVLVLGVSLTWAFFSMRAVMDVGGSCADGGPYVSAQPCPGGAVLIAFAIPMMILAAMVGTAVALSVSAPNLLIPMWAVLFGSVGWNFLEFGFPADSGPVWGWVVCGVVFWAMAAPAVYVILLGLRRTLASPSGGTGPRPARTWWVLYPVLGGLGIALGVLSFNALS